MPRAIPQPHLDHSPLTSPCTMRNSHWPDLFPLLQWLGYGGLVPFFSLALAGWSYPDPAFQSACLALLQAYGLAIITFVGAISWGLALGAPDLEPRIRGGLVVWSVMPSLIGCVAFILPPAAGFFLLAAVAAIAFAVDFRMAPRIGLPQAWIQLRLHLSLGAIISLVIGAHAVAALGA